MMTIPITNIPNQTLSINLDGNIYDISISATNDIGLLQSGIVAFDVVINNVVIVTGMRALPDFPIIPSRYLENGNFLVSTMGDEYPDWRQFGITQSLIYVSQSELDTIRANA
jgi:hypothetical protein